MPRLWHISIYDFVYWLLIVFIFLVWCIFSLNQIISLYKHMLYFLKKVENHISLMEQGWNRITLVMHFEGIVSH